MESLTYFDGDVARRVRCEGNSSPLVGLGECQDSNQAQQSDSKTANHELHVELEHNSTTSS